MKEAAALFGLAAFSLLILLPGAGSPSQITRGDVYMYVLMNVLGILEVHDYKMLRWDRVNFDFSKPPLAHWITAGALNHIANPFLAVRLLPILCTAASALITYSFGRLLGQSRVRAAAAALLFLSCWGVFNYGRQPLLEAPLLLPLLVAVYGVSRACAKEEPAWLLIAGAATGVSAMVKWFIGPATIFLFMAVYLPASGRWGWLKRRKLAFASAVALALGVGLAYPIYLFTKLFEPRFFLFQLYRQMVAERYREPTSVLEFLSRGLLVSTLPWTPLLFAALWSVRRLGRETKAVLGSWLAAVIVPTLMIVSRTDRYAFPALPALALAVTACLDGPQAPWRIARRTMAVLMALSFPAVLAALWWLRLLPPWAAVPGIIAAFEGARALWRTDEPSLTAPAACAGLCLMLSCGAGYAAVGFNEIPPQIIALIGNRTVYRFDNTPESASTGYLQLYLKRRVYIQGVGNDLQLDGSGRMLAVATGGSLELLKVAAEKNGARFELLASWKNYHTNPRAAGVKILRMLRDRSLEPIAVTHYLASLERPMQWIPLAGGSFAMGSTDGPERSQPRHKVAVKRFQMSKTMVTIDQYGDCVKAGACAPPKTFPCVLPPLGDAPVVCVDWEQARTYAKWAGARLPSEAEWEYAARSGGKERKYPWGDDEPTFQRTTFGNLTDTESNRPPEPIPVCSKPLGNTEQGLCDMAGNALEWVEDSYHASYRGAPADGRAWVSSPVVERVTRGGCFFCGAELLRTTARVHADPDSRVYNGIRLAR